MTRERSTPQPLGLETVRRALDGSRADLADLVRTLTPVIQARVARVLMAHGNPTGRDVSSEVQDFTQDVFVALFENRGRALRNWDPARGLSLANYVGLAAHRLALSRLRTGKRNPFTEDPTLNGVLEARAGTGRLEEETASKEILQEAVKRVEERLSPLGLALLGALVIEERPVQEVAATFGMTREAVYTWRSRLIRLFRACIADLLPDSRSQTRSS